MYNTQHGKQMVENRSHKTGNKLLGRIGKLIGAMALCAGFLNGAYAAVTINATISTYAAFAAQNVGNTPGMLVIQRADDNDQWNAMGVDWITVNQNQTYSSAKAGAGYYWAFFNHNNAAQAIGCEISGIGTIDASNRANGTYLANGASLNITITCTMPASAATVTTQAVSSIASTSATGNGTITDLGSPNPTAYGICWGLTSSISSCTNKINKGAASATGAYTAAITGLNPGTTYYTRAYATNTSGTVYGSALSFSTLKTAQTITFNNPGSLNFGSTPTLSASTTATGLTVSFTSGTSSVCSITSGGALTFLSTGTCTIHADQAGDAIYGAATKVSQSFVVNAVVPSAPTIGSATTTASGQATVTFTAPAFTGGSAITGYTVVSEPGGLTGTGSSSPIAVTGLTNGVSYTFTVKATTTAGSGAASIASNAVVPMANQSITFANPGSLNFGSTPTLSASTTATGLTVSFTSGTPGVCSITSGGALTFLSTGACTIHADQSGDVAYTAAQTVTESFTVSAVVPGAPSIVTVIASDGQATVSFTAPGFTGGSEITGYTVVSNLGGLSATSAASPITVTGLTNGTAYTFTVTAQNAVGSGSASIASNAVVPTANQTITFVDFASVTYGEADIKLNVQASSGLAVVLASDNEKVARIAANGLVQVVGAGTATITATQPGNDAFLAAVPVSKVLDVSKAQLTITALNDTITEGDLERALEVHVDGFVNADDLSVLTGLEVTRESGLAAGKYRITPTATASNYEISFVDGWFVVLDAPSSVLANMAKNFGVRRVSGGLSLTGVRGHVVLYNLHGERVWTIEANHDGFYAMDLRPEFYVLRSGSRGWTLAPPLTR